MFQPRQQLPAVVLEPPTAGRQREYLAAVRRSRKDHHPWVTPPATATQFARWLARADLSTQHPFFICRRGGGDLVGVATLSEIVRGSLPSADLGYYLFTSCVGRGYMTAGLRFVLREAFGPMRLDRIEANIQPGNDASRAVLRRLRFRFEGSTARYLKIAGRWRDHERWALLVEDWRKRRRSGR